MDFTKLFLKICKLGMARNFKPVPDPDEFAQTWALKNCVKKYKITMLEMENWQKETIFIL